MGCSLLVKSSSSSRRLLASGPDCCNRRRPRRGSAWRPGSPRRWPASAAAAVSSPRPGRWSRSSTSARTGCCSRRPAWPAGVPAEHGEHAAEDLPRGDRHVLGHVGEDRRLDEAAAGQPGSAGGRRRPPAARPRPGPGRCSRHPVAVGRGDQRAHGGGRVLSGPGLICFSSSWTRSSTSSWMASCRKACWSSRRTGRTSRVHARHGRAATRGRIGVGEGDQRVPTSSSRTG